MPRYWVSLHTENPDATKQEAKLEKELEELSNHVGGDTLMQYSYVTEDLENAKEVAMKAVDIYRKYGLEHMTDFINITKQPECPKCGHFGRFRDDYCSECGTKLTSAEEIPYE